MSVHAGAHGTSLCTCKATQHSYKSGLQSQAGNQSKFSLEENEVSFQVLPGHGAAVSWQDGQRSVKIQCGGSMSSAGHTCHPTTGQVHVGCIGFEDNRVTCSAAATWQTIITGQWNVQLATTRQRQPCQPWLVMCSFRCPYIDRISYPNVTVVNVR